MQSVKVQVWLNYQGRSEMRYEHILTYDQDEHEKSFLYDNKAERLGLEAAIVLINNDVNRVLNAMVIDDFAKVDAALTQYFAAKQAKEEDVGTNVIKVVSEALLLATAACYDRHHIHKAINLSVFKQKFVQKNTKLLINIFNGGKVAGSAVKFAKFYLIVDGSEAKGGVDVTESFIKFSQSVRKAVQTTKQGVSVFDLVTLLIGSGIQAGRGGFLLQRVCVDQRDVQGDRGRDRGQRGQH